MLEEGIVEPWLPLEMPSDSGIEFAMDRILNGAAVVTAEKEEKDAQP